MAICSHCGRQSQENALICQFCGSPLTTQESDISAFETVYTSPPDQDIHSQNGQNGQNGAQATTIEQQGSNAMAKVIVRPLQGAGEQPREYALTGQTISIGRSPSCEIVLEHDQLTSRRHALLRFDGARYTVVDLGSSNGTFVNDAEIRDATALNDGDRIIVGEHELTFTTSADVAAPIASVDLNGAPPSSPLGVTGEQPAVNLGQQEMDNATVMAGSVERMDDDDDEAETSYMATVMAPMEAVPAAEVADTSDVGDVSTVANGSAIADVSEVADVGDVSEVGDVSDLGDAAETVAVPSGVAENVSEPMGDMGDMGDIGEQPSSGPLPMPSTPDGTPLLARAPSSGALSQPGGELDQLRTQLAQLSATSEAVAQHAAQETTLSEQRRQALAETRDQLHAILAGIQNASSQASDADDEPGDLSDLIAVSQQAADDPNHLQNVSRLAEHANEITRALQALQAKRIQPPRPTAEENALAELRALQARLDDLA